MTTANVLEPDFDERRERPGFAALRAVIGRQAGCRRLGASVWEVPPGNAAYTYHAHLGDEELIVVLSGRPSLRTPAGWRELEPGEVVALGRGEASAHQLVNRGQEPVRFLALATNSDTDVVLYPDEGKMAAVERGPDGFRFISFFRLRDGVGYWDDVEIAEP